MTHTMLLWCGLAVAEIVIILLLRMKNHFAATIATIISGVAFGICCSIAKDHSIASGFYKYLLVFAFLQFFLASSIMEAEKRVYGHSDEDNVKRRERYKFYIAVWLIVAILVLLSAIYDDVAQIFGWKSLLDILSIIISAYQSSEDMAW